MNKLPMALVLMTAGISAAQAQDTYQADEFRRETCLAVAMRAKNAWSYKVAGERYPTETMSPSISNVLHMKAIQLAGGSTSQREAIRSSIAMCLDNVDRVYRDARGGRQTDIGELQ